MLQQHLFLIQDGESANPAAGKARLAGPGLQRPRHRRAEGFGQLQGQSVDGSLFHFLIPKAVADIGNLGR